MPLLTDRQEIRQLLWRDPVWAVYALGDLGPQLWPKTEWRRAGGELALVLRAYATPILWASGGLEELAEEITGEARYSVQVRPEALGALGRHYEMAGLKPMWRMGLDPADFCPPSVINAVRLRTADMAELEALYQDGTDAGESPDFFFSEMVANGVFYGCRNNGRLTAVAGTHVVDVDEGVGAIGNVYVRRDSRQRGLAAQVTAAVVRELQSMGIQVVALNVYQSNAAALRVYERLGFRRHGEYFEGTIERR